MNNDDIIKTLMQLEYPYPIGDEQEKINEALKFAIKAVRQMDCCPVFSDDEVKQPCIESPCSKLRDCTTCKYGLESLKFEKCLKCIDYSEWEADNE